jgi:two-component system chemotaxis response regulator CheY
MKWTPSAQAHLRDLSGYDRQRSANHQTKLENRSSSSGPPRLLLRRSLLSAPEIRIAHKKGLAMKLKALVIDDSGVMRKMVMKSLTEAKLAEFEFVEAEDGQIALDKLKTNDIDIAFVDWNMPVMTGVDFVKAVREQEKISGDIAIPLVMITSEKTIGKVQEALDEAGADSFISKPFTVEEMQHKLKKHADRAQLVRIRKERNKRQAAATASQAQASASWFGKMFS